MECGIQVADPVIEDEPYSKDTQTREQTFEMAPISPRKPQRTPFDRL